MYSSRYRCVLLALLLLFSPLGLLGEETRTTYTRTESSSSSYASASSHSSSSSTTVVYASGGPTEPAEPETVPSPSVRAVPSLSPSPSPSPSPTPSPQLPPSPSPMPKNVTKSVRNAVTSANVKEVATLLIENEDVVELGLGFTFSDEERNRVLFQTPERITDPDVVSLKGLAKAALEANISSRLTEVFIVAIYGTDFDTNLCPDDVELSYSKTVTKTKTRTTSGYTRTTNSSGTFTVYHEPETFSKSWTDNYGSDEFEMDMEVDAMESQEAENEWDNTPECFTPEEIKIIRSNLKEDFSDLELMASILEGNPGKSVRDRSRGLLVWSGTPVNSWICSFCWRKRFCNKHAHWCPL